MRDKVVWLTVWVTLAYWVGGAGGCAQAPTASPARSSDFSDRQPLLGGDRADWPKIQVGPADGRVLHHPLYFNSAPLTPLLGSPAPTGPLDVTADGWAELQIYDTGFQPARFAVELVCLPVTVFIDAPWDWQ